MLLVSLLGNRWHQRTLIILGAAKWCLPDRRLEPAKLPRDSLPQVLQQVEAISDLAKPAARLDARHPHTCRHDRGIDKFSVSRM